MREQDHIRKTKTLSGRLGLFLLILLTATQSYFNVSCIGDLEVRQHVPFSSIETPHHANHDCLFDQQREQTPNAICVTSIDRDRQPLKRSQYLVAVSLFYSLSSTFALHAVKIIQAVPFDSAWHLFKFAASLRTTVIIV